MGSYFGDCRRRWIFNNGRRLVSRFLLLLYRFDLFGLRLQNEQTVSLGSLCFQPKIKIAYHRKEFFGMFVYGFLYGLHKWERKTRNFRALEGLIIEICRFRIRHLSPHQLFPLRHWWVLEQFRSFARCLRNVTVLCQPHGYAALISQKLPSPWTETTTSPRATLSVLHLWHTWPGRTYSIKPVESIVTLDAYGTKSTMPWHALPHHMYPGLYMVSVLGSASVVYATKCFNCILLIHHHHDCNLRFLLSMISSFRTSFNLPSLHLIKGLHVSVPDPWECLTCLSIMVHISQVWLHWVKDRPQVEWRIIAMKICHYPKEVPCVTVVTSNFWRDSGPLSCIFRLKESARRVVAPA